MPGVDDSTSGFLRSENGSWGGARYRFSFIATREGSGNLIVERCRWRRKRRDFGGASGCLLVYICT